MGWHKVYSCTVFSSVRLGVFKFSGIELTLQKPLFNFMEKFFYFQVAQSHDGDIIQRSTFNRDSRTIPRYIRKSLPLLFS